MRPRCGHYCLPLLIGLGTLPTSAAAQTPDTLAEIEERDLSGPRVGMTYVIGGPLRKDLEGRNIGPAFSQFGWHFEHSASPRSRGPWFIVETVLLVGGVEYGRIIPSGTLAMGVRLPDGFEFGLGPNATLVGGSQLLRTSLVAAVGRSFRFDGVSVPVNVAFAFDRDGQRVSVITGWAVRNQPRGSDASRR